MDNILLIKGTEYKLEKIWRPSRKDGSKDAKGNKYPWPKEGIEWTDRLIFIDRLEKVQEALDGYSSFKKYSESKNCHLCNKLNVSTKRYCYKKTMWEDGLIHYMEQHMIEPNLEFKDLIYRADIFDKLKDDISRPNKKKNTENPILRIVGKKMESENTNFVRIEKNQLMILDALMIHGGYGRKYNDPEKEKVFRYSEHAGMLDFDKNKLTKIVVFGSTNRVDEGDDEIYMPIDPPDIWDYEYIFHTHPPTPRPGGRAKGGVLYEFPSCGDIFHFIDHYNDGNVIGSLVVTSEGLYCIRRYTPENMNRDKIIVDEDMMYRAYQKEFSQIQKDSVNKYGTDFTTEQFFQKIAQDRTAINHLNSVMNQYDIHIDFYPRKKDKSDRWILDTVFLVFRSV